MGTKIMVSDCGTHGYPVRVKSSANPRVVAARRVVKPTVAKSKRKAVLKKATSQVKGKQPVYSN